MPESAKSLFIKAQVLTLLVVILLGLISPMEAVAFGNNTPNSPSLGTPKLSGGIAYRFALQTGSADEVIYLPVIYNEVSNPPTDIAISNNSLPENEPTGTTVGSFSTIDPNTGNTFTYTLVDGVGSTDNNFFQIEDSDLHTGAVFDFETKSSYSIRVRSTDNTSLYTEKAFTVSVTNVNEPPVLTNIEGTALNFNENSAPAAVTSTLTVSDPDALQIESAVISIVQNYQSGADILGFSNQSGITGNFDPGTGVLVLYGTALPADYQEALRSVTFVNNSHTPAAGARVVYFQVNDGALASNTQSREVAVTAVNDGPVNTVPAAQTVNEDTDLIFSTANNNAISIADVDAASSNMKLSLDVTHGTLTLATYDGLIFVDGTSNGQASVHVVGSINQINAALNGLKYRGTQHYNSTRGAETLVVLVSDQGSTGVGGALTDTDTVSITVNAVNDPPVAQEKAFSAHTNMKIGLGGLLTGAVDPDTGDGGYTATLSIGTISATTPAGGTISNVDTSTGTFDFDPPPGSSGNVTFTYTVCDSGSPGAALCSSPAMVTVNVTGPVIWFVNPAVSPDGDGRLSSPFKTLAAANAVDAANHRIFIYSGNAAGGFNLETGEWLIGQGVTGASFDAVFSINPPAGTIARPAINGTRPSVLGGVTMTSNSVVRGLNVTPGPGFSGLSATGATGLSVGDTSVVTTSAPAVYLINSDGTFTFTSISSSGGTNGIVWNNASPAAGSLTITGTGSTAGSGGTIQNTTLYGVQLIRASNVSLNRMVIQNIARNGVDGTGVVNFAFTNGTINLTGTAATGEHEENGIDFSESVTHLENNVSGTVTITGSTITGARRNAIYIHNYSGTLFNLNISSNNLSGGTTTASIADAIKVIAAGSASTNANLNTAQVQNNTISGFQFMNAATSKYIGGSGIIMNGGSGTLLNVTSSTFGTQAAPITISGNSITNMGSSAIAVAFNGTNGTGYINISSNGTQATPINNVEGIGISVLFAGGNDFAGSATINNNVIDTNGATTRAGLVGIGMQLESIDTLANNNTPQATFTITNNTVLHPDGHGIRVYVRNSNATAKVKMQNNSVGAPFAAFAQSIRVDNGSSAGNSTMCLNISGNTGAVNGSYQGIGLRKQGTDAIVNNFGIHGLSPSPATGTQAAAYVYGLNPAGNGVNIINGDNFMNCSLP